MLSTTVDQVGEVSQLQSDESLEEYDEKEDRSSTTHHQLSCQQCRNRKVKCDRKTPSCMQCVRKTIDCTYPHAFKGRPKRQRVLVSADYEKKIDELSSKLDRLCHLVAAGTQRPAVVEPAHGQPSSSSSSTAFPTQDAAPSRSSSAAGEFFGLNLNDEPTLAAQAAFATNYAKSLFQFGVESGEMTRSLDRLGQILRENQTLSKSPEENLLLSSPDMDVGKIKLPPLELATSCIQKLRDSNSLRFYWTWDIDTVGQLLESTIAAYTTQPSMAQLVIVNSTLSRLFNDCMREEPSSSAQAELKAQARQCEANLAFVISKLPFNLSKTFDNILALYHITVYMMGLCKPLAAWNYIAASIQMCQSLGYHREQALVPESSQQRRRRKRLVWMIVIIDKTLSLRIGRSSSIRDGEFTLEKLPDIAQDDVSAFSFMTLLSKWIDMALLQGQAYDDVFSPRALLQPQSIRITRIRALAADLQRVFEATSAEEDRVFRLRRRALGDEMHELFLRADRITHLATLTLMYRAIPAGPYSNSIFCEECVATALEALNEHQKCLIILNNLEGSALEMYLQWAILSSPFVPFIVLFCRALETCSPEYLDTLSSVVVALNLLPADLPRAYRIQLKVFKVMHEVACDYIQANNKGRVVNNRTPDLGARKSFEDPGVIMESSSSSVVMQYTPNNDSGAMSTLDMLEGEFPPQTNMQPQIGDSGTDLSTLLDQSQIMFTMLEDMF